MAPPDPAQFEKLASFYLGRQFDLAAGTLLDQLMMYDAKDLCTHAMCVGMTGSGKTGLCLSLLEEAAIDGIPAICVDPKGDLANLCLTFPDLSPSDFKPWLESGEAARQGLSLDEFAAETANRWRTGLADWGQSPERIRSFQDAVDVAIYTPGSNLGLPLTVLKRFDAPGAETVQDSEAFGERITGSVSGLLTLLGIDADPLTSREHILLASLLDHQWRQGINVSIAELIRLVSSPPMTRVGVMDLETFMPAGERSKLAMRLNNLLASPAFASWLEGESLSISRLLYTASGKPRISILSIAHLSASERMFFVTILLNELVAWMRQQSGTSSLRAMFYMDEVAGYFPPVANPPSKAPMLTLLKQARAFGLGITLATQNPVDLDYKGLSNIGTWFLGRLQTERDKARVIEGLEGVAGQTGQAFDRGAIEQTLAGLGKRVFLMNNVHDDAPVTFHSRWAMSFLAGPLARDQISRLMEPRKQADLASQDRQRESVAEETGAVTRPVVPAGVDERFLAVQRRPAADSRTLYRPAVLGRSSMHFVRANAGLDLWVDDVCLIRCASGLPQEYWERSEPLSDDQELLSQPEEGIQFSELPDDLRGKAVFRSLKSKLKDYLYRHRCVTLYQCSGVSGYAPVSSHPPISGDTGGRDDEREAKLHFRQLLREKRDLETERLRERYAKKMESLEKKIRTAEQRVQREASQYGQAKWSSLLSVGSSLLGAFMGGRRGGVMTAARGVGRASQQRDDVLRAEQAVQALQKDMRKLENELRDEIDALTKECDLEDVPLEPTEIPPRKSDLRIQDVALLWTPWQVDANGIASPLFETPR